MSCKSILVVEDNEDIREQVSLALEVEGYHVLQACHGGAALELLKSLKNEEIPGCMILDLMMPVMDGLTLMDTIAHHYQTEFGKIHILVATAKGSPIDPSRVPQAVERVKKPFDLIELYRVVEKHCGKP